jgi:hypothetical protein
LQLYAEHHQEDVEMTLDEFLAAVAEAETSDFPFFASCKAPLADVARYVFAYVDAAGDGHQAFSFSEFREAMFLLSSCPVAPAGRNHGAFHAANQAAHDGETFHYEEEDAAVEPVEGHFARFKQTMTDV